MKLTDILGKGIVLFNWCIRCRSLRLDNGWIGEWVLHSRTLWRILDFFEWNCGDQLSVGCCRMKKVCCISPYRGQQKMSPLMCSQEWVGSLDLQVKELFKLIGQPEQRIGKGEPGQVVRSPNEGNYLKLEALLILWWQETERLMCCPTPMYTFTIAQVNHEIDVAFSIVADDNLNRMSPKLVLELGRVMVNFRRYVLFRV